MQKGEQTRQRIIEEAAKIFNQRGFAGCSIQDVMEATGLEKGGVYRHFASKEELAVEAFRYALSLSVKMRTEGPGYAGSAIEQLRYAVRHFIETPSVFPGGCPLMNTAVDANDGNPALRQLACDALKKWRAVLCSIVEDGIAHGEIRSGANPRQIANTIIASLEGALMISRLEGTKRALCDVQEMFEMILAEIGTAREVRLGSAE
jgi:TetR/AcrR family transcriptional repressor of nem operon